MPKDILSLIFENVDDNRTWRQLSQICRQAYKLSKELMHVEYLTAPLSGIEKYITIKNGQWCGLQITIEKYGTALIKVEICYTNSDIRYIWWNGFKSHYTTNGAKQLKCEYNYQEIKYQWVGRSFVITCNYKNDQIIQHVFGLEGME